MDHGSKDRRGGRDAAPRVPADRAEVAYATQVRELVARAWTEPPTPAAAAELLTAGAALALALETRCRRLEREIADLAPRAEEPEAARRLRTLPPELRGVERQLETVRRALAELRRHVERV
jgi:hypothetical protein